jgi:hypothetical protein
MHPKLFPKTLLGLLSILSTVLLYSQAPYTSALEKEYQGSFTIGKCDVSSITSKVRLSTLVGEPTVFVNIKWRNGSGSSSDCLGNEKFNVFVKVYSNYSSSYFYIPADGAMGLIPDGDNTWGQNPLAGSPSWHELLAKDPVYRTQNGSYNFVSADYAKSVWKYGLYLKAVVLMDKSGRLFHIQN